MTPDTQPTPESNRCLRWSIAGIITLGLLSPVGLVLSTKSFKREPRRAAFAGVLLGALGTGWILGVVILSTLLTIGAIWGTKALTDPTVSASAEMSRVLVAVKVYQKTQHTMPSTIDDLVLGADDRVDPWGHPYLLSTQSDGSWTITSLGPDGLPDTSDDMKISGRIKVDAPD